jgi:hypothetical protein
MWKPEYGSQLQMWKPENGLFYISVKLKTLQICENIKRNAFPMVSNLLIVKTIKSKMYRLVWLISSK